MKILIATSQHDTFLTTDDEHMPALVNLLPHLRVVNQEGWGDTTRYTVADMPPEMKFEDEAKLRPMTPREAALAKALEEKNSAWAKEYIAANELRAKLKALEPQS